jgi:hypothetical protein
VQRLKTTVVLWSSVLSWHLCQVVMAPGIAYLYASFLAVLNRIITCFRVYAINNCSFDHISNCKACLLSLDLVVPVDFGKCIGEASSCA